MPTKPLGRTGRTSLGDRVVTADSRRALGGHDDAETRPHLFPHDDPLGDSLQGVRNLREKNDVRTAGDPRVQRDPPGVASHHFEHHDAMMRLRGGVQAINCSRRDGHSGIEADSCRGLHHVVVDSDADKVSRAAVELYTIASVPSPPTAMRVSIASAPRRSTHAAETSSISPLACGNARGLP